jgi:hypothetical protein
MGFHWRRNKYTIIVYPEVVLKVVLLMNGSAKNSKKRLKVAC